MSKPANPELYARVKREAKRRFSRWPSAYGSAWLVKEYKRRGGTYRSKTRSARKGVGKWMREEWVQVGPAVEEGRYVPCGGRERDGKACRPRVRRDSRTPMTVAEVVRAHGRSKVLSLARRKSRDMKTRIDWVRGRSR